ncbi:MAG: hypothetical protein AB1679_17695 [Actinomycetota bacterium]|jgi:hypothetical protein
MGQKNEPYYGEDTDHHPHMGEREEPEGTENKNKRMSTGTTASDETGADMDDAGKTGMRPTGSGGSAPPPQNR